MLWENIEEIIVAAEDLNSYFKIENGKLSKKKELYELLRKVCEHSEVVCKEVVIRGELFNFF